MLQHNEKLCKKFFQDEYKILSNLNNSTSTTRFRLSASPVMMIISQSLVRFASPYILNGRSCNISNLKSGAIIAVTRIHCTIIPDKHSSPQIRTRGNNTIWRFYIRIFPRIVFYKNYLISIIFPKA